MSDNESFLGQNKKILCPSNDILPRMSYFKKLVKYLRILDKNWFILYSTAGGIFNSELNIIIEFAVQTNLGHLKLFFRQIAKNSSKLSYDILENIFRQFKKFHKFFFMEKVFTKLEIVENSSDSCEEITNSIKKIAIL